ncbi:RagB/SusD family nutrient uptake outer membrane protein [Sphingobacterium corticibacterium]|uniref:RagB/SusD family nutrient uptake outer membrane protein n=1 Tax=Sphingobacterium corticibacterium TaxID=2484746 RepID=A0A4Q6XP15_9SPHI|nr:RagB/SusD family nutrient uptake outer membrane protein [Sphingobacterium corticibacterium]RZF58349.1 RagB/SusD family nutrient uptake outer membrane protein [Sphingobacterium corticibacterium]
MRTKFLYLFYIVLFTSCSSFLEVDPKSSLSGEGIIKDETSANAAISGVYDALRSYYSVDYQSIAYLSGDNVQWTGSQSQVQEFINNKVNPENSTISSTWNGIYRTINRANNVINALVNYEGDGISAAVKDNVLGQAYAIRGLAYFDLVRVWGGVPLITEPTEKVGDNIGIERSTVAQTYQQVIDDLNLAEDLLPSATDRFAFTKKTVWALKARYHLYQKNWEGARDYAKLLIDDQSNYELIAPYYSFFKNNVTGTKESVFELFYSANEANPHRAQWQPQTNGGTRQWAPSEELIALLTNASTAGARSQLIARDNQNRWYGDLYYRSTGADPTYVIRIAEVYLIRAEAYAELEEYNLAVDDLNKVRERTSLADKSYTTNQADLLLWIEDERRLEFAFEAHRWFDLVRTGRAQQVLGITESFRLLLPIPYSQILADPALKQNPDYSS